MRISDWSSDVCSSDLGVGAVDEAFEAVVAAHLRHAQRKRDLADILVALLGADRARADEVAELFGDVARRFQVLAGQHDDELLAAIARREPKPAKEMLPALHTQPPPLLPPPLSPP